MDDYTFSEQLPSGTSSVVDYTLFNDTVHLMLQAPAGWHGYYAISHKHRRVDALLHLYVDGSEARSPYRAPFASLEFSDQIPLPTLYNFIDFIEARLKAKGVSSVRLTNPPREYHPQHLSLLEVFLINHGWSIVNAEVGCMIKTGQRFEQSADNWEKRKLRQAVEASLNFVQLASDKLDEVYFFILACRKKKNYSLSMTLPDLRKAFETFPDKFSLFGVYHEQQLVAASVTVAVNKHVLYHFYTDHDSAFDHLSPVVFLIHALHQYALDRKFDWIDLGTSAYDDKPNFGLMNFKMRTGGIATSKFTFAKNL